MCLNESKGKHREARNKFPSGFPDLLPGPNELYFILCIDVFFLLWLSKICVKFSLALLSLRTDVCFLLSAEVCIYCTEKSSQQLPALCIRQCYLTMFTARINNYSVGCSLAVCTHWENFGGGGGWVVTDSTSQIRRDVSKLRTARSC